MMSDEPVSRFFVSQRLRLHYVDWGNEGAPPLLLLHGGRDHCRNWDWVARDLRRDFHVVAPDLRGHGDSEWERGGLYAGVSHIYDLAQFIHQQALAPLTIIAHSLGGHIALRYAGLYPEAVSRLVAIEGVWLPPVALVTERDAAQRVRDWIEQQRGLAARQPRHYATFDEALARMQAANTHLSEAQARHLTYHGLRRNEDGSYTWKFDNYVRSFPPVDIGERDLYALWERIECPTLLVHGRESWMTDPEKDGRMAYFRNARLAWFDKAGHWVHHDRTEAFLACVRDFLNA